MMTRVAKSGFAVISSFVSRVTMEVVAQPVNKEIQIANNANLFMLSSFQMVAPRSKYCFQHAPDRTGGTMEARLIIIKKTNFRKAETKGSLRKRVPPKHSYGHLADTPSYDILQKVRAYAVGFGCLNEIMNEIR
jgi:hypothetical protein